MSQTLTVNVVGRLERRLSEMSLPLGLSGRNLVPTPARHSQRGSPPGTTELFGVNKGRISPIVPGPVIRLGHLEQPSSPLRAGIGPSGRGGIMKDAFER